MGIEVQRLTKKFGAQTAISEMTFDLESGTIASVLGPSGSGKSTLLRCIAGVETPDTGSITLDGKAVFDSDSRVDLPPEARGVGMVYQSYALWPHMTVQENVAYPLKIRKDPETKNKVTEVLDLLRLGGLSGRYPYELSGGEQQRVALARSVVYRPSVVLLDEPFSNLDAPMKDALRDELKLLQRSLKTTMIYVTHDRVDALSVGDTLIVLDSGRISARGSPQELIRHPPNSFAARFVDGMLVIDGKVVHAVGSKATVDTALGPFEVQNPDDLEGDVKLCFDEASVSMAGGAVENRLVGKVAGITRRPSEDPRARVVTATGTVELRLDSTTAPTVAIGDEVSLRLDGARCLLLKS